MKKKKVIKTLKIRLTRTNRRLRATEKLFKTEKQCKNQAFFFILNMGLLEEYRHSAKRIHRLLIGIPIVWNYFSYIIQMGELHPQMKVLIYVNDHFNIFHMKANKTCQQKNHIPK